MCIQCRLISLAVYCIRNMFLCLKINSFSIIKLISLYFRTPELSWHCVMEISFYHMSSKVSNLILSRSACIKKKVRLFLSNTCSSFWKRITSNSCNISYYFLKKDFTFNLLFRFDLHYEQCILSLDV